MSFIYVIILIAVFAKVQFEIYRKHSFSAISYNCRFSKDEVSEGDEIELVEEIVNRKLLPLPFLKSEITSSKWLDFAASQSLITEETRFVPSFFTLKSYSKTVRRWKVKCNKRGVYKIDKVVLITTDLLGLASFSNSYTTPSTLTVLPSPADLEADFESASGISGDVVVRRNFIDDPFYRAGVKEYTPRDPISKIHWPATAKAGKLMVHNNMYTADRELLVILNMQSRSYEMRKVIDPENVENGIRICAGFFEDTVQSGIPVRFAANWSAGDKRETLITNSFHGAEHVKLLMETLSALTLRSSDTFRSTLSYSLSEITASDIVIVTSYLSDFIYDFARERTALGSEVKIIFTSKLTDEELPPDCAVFGYSGKENCVL